MVTTVKTAIGEFNGHGVLIAILNHSEKGYCLAIDIDGERKGRMGSKESITEQFNQFADKLENKVIIG